MPSHPIARMLSMACCAAHVVLGSVDADAVVSLPGFPTPFPMKVFSGFLDVAFDPPIDGMDGASIHYQFHVSQRNESDPVVAWHTGGPGGSSIYGQYAEVGYFQVSTSAGETTNPHAWSGVASMLYLESPAGSFLTPVDQLTSGFSYCTKAGVRQKVCSWNDVTQAEAYGHTLRAFFAAYPEFATNEFFLAGESYAGQYIPNIATHLLAKYPDINLKGIAVGNGCWGGDADSVVCNGPNDAANDVELYHGKGLVSDRLYGEIKAVCGADYGAAACEVELQKMDAAVGPHNVYNIYDNCPNLDLKTWSERSGKSMRFLRSFLARRMADLPSAHAELDAMAGVEVVLGNPASGGGYDWTCGQFDAIPPYFKRPDVRAALHLPNVTGSTFAYESTGPASVTLYPALIKQIRVLIYNGDADTCVPYIGNEEWTTAMLSDGVVTEVAPWHPWFATPDASAPAGYATVYSEGFQFVTIRLAGHQVPKNNPEAALTLITGFLAGDSF